MNLRAGKEGQELLGIILVLGARRDVDRICRGFFSTRHARGDFREDHEAQIVIGHAAILEGGDGEVAHDIVRGLALHQQRCVPMHESALARHGRYRRHLAQRATDGCGTALFEHQHPLAAARQFARHGRTARTTADDDGVKGGLGRRVAGWGHWFGKTSKSETRLPHYVDQRGAPDNRQNRCINTGQKKSSSEATPEKDFVSCRPSQKNLAGAGPYRNRQIEQRPHKQPGPVTN